MPCRTTVRMVSSLPTTVRVSFSVRARFLRASYVATTASLISCSNHSCCSYSSVLLCYDVLSILESKVGMEWQLQDLCYV